MDCVKGRPCTGLAGPEEGGGPREQKTGLGFFREVPCCSVSSVQAEMDRLAHARQPQGPWIRIFGPTEASEPNRPSLKCPLLPTLSGEFRILLAALQSPLRPRSLWLRGPPGVSVSSSVESTGSVL